MCIRDRIQPVGKDFAAIACQHVDKQARQKQAQTPNLRADHENSGNPQQIEQQPCAGVWLKAPALFGSHYAIPVSYTHLDVYKRQVLFLPS